MADRILLVILKRSVKTWNWLRKFIVIPDLIKAKLIGADLSEANLSEVCFVRANLHKAKLSRADLRMADLSETDLSETDLSRANLKWANLSKADLSGANLSEANLASAKLGEANLNGANLGSADLKSAELHDATFKGADLSAANLHWADLSRAEFLQATLRGASLNEANLSETNLSEANLNEADLSMANLNKADLSAATCYKSNLSGANLSTARLMNTILDGATLTGACLWETQRAGWSIKGVICENVNWNVYGKETNVYSPGEFEKLFADKIKVRLFYKGGISPLEIATLPALIKHLEDSHPGGRLRLVTIREDAGGVVVELAIEDTGDQSPEELRQLKIEMEATAQRAIEYERLFLDEEKQRLQLEGRLEELRLWYREQQLLLASAKQINVQGDYKDMGDEYNVSGQAGAVGQNAHAHDNTFNQIVNHFEKSIDLQALATQLAELREEMAKRQDSSPQAIISQGEAAKAEIAAKEGNTSKVVEHLKAVGEWTLDFAKEIGKEVVVAAIKASMGMQ